MHLHFMFFHTLSWMGPSAMEGKVRGKWLSALTNLALNRRRLVLVSNYSEIPELLTLIDP